MEEVVIQGFICPFCMEDFGDFDRLQNHVNDDHAENEEDADLTDAVVQNVRGLFDKAKRGIKRLDSKINIPELPAEVPRPLAKLRPLPPDVIPNGITRSATSEFRKLRDESINETSIRTNMLIIRLDRLINAGPKEPSKRREFEREIVPWLDDQDVVCCPLCAARFGLTRRKHHCRLCGRVLCHNCSQFLSFLSARKLTNPAIAFQMQESLASMNSDVVETSKSTSGKQKLISITQQSMDRMKNLIGKVQTVTTGDDTSVSSLLQQDATESLRVCSGCLNDLHRRENMMEQGKPPAVVEQYEHLRDCVAEIKQLVPTYVRLATSINNGETMYTLKSVEEMRQKCLEKQHHVDLVSKRIAEDSECGLREQQMRRNIRSTTLQVLQGLIGQTTSLPTAEEYAKLVKKHKEQVAKQVAAARERSQMASDRMLKASSSMPLISSSSNNPSTSSLTSLNSRKSPPMSRAMENTQVDDGWIPQQSKAYNPFLEDDDSATANNSPLIEQRDQIRGFLAQAASAGKLDEVEMLERNLKEIEEIIRSMELE